MGGSGALFPRKEAPQNTARLIPDEFQKGVARVEAVVPEPPHRRIDGVRLRRSRRRIDGVRLRRFRLLLDEPERHLIEREALACAVEVVDQHDAARHRGLALLVRRRLEEARGVVEPLDLARRPATSTFHGTRVAIPRGGSDWPVGWWLGVGGWGLG